MRSALLLLALFAGGAVGCVDNDASLSILQMEAVTEASGCTATAGSMMDLSSGTFDVSLGNGLQGYIGFPVVRNNEVSRMPSADSPELNSIQIIGANVSLSFIDPAAASKVKASDTKFFWSAAGGRVDPGGLAPMQIEVVPESVIKELNVAKGSVVTVLAKIQPVGLQTSDRIVGGPIHFPVDICNGCLVNVVGDCPLPMGTVIVDSGCIPSQDVAPTCCDDKASGQMFCGAAAPIATAAGSQAQPPTN
jgi:hypothetical protein